MRRFQLLADLDLADVHGGLHVHLERPVPLTRPQYDGVFGVDAVGHVFLPAGATPAGAVSVIRPALELLQARTQAAAPAAVSPTAAVAIKAAVDLAPTLVAATGLLLSRFLGGSSDQEKPAGYAPPAPHYTGDAPYVPAPPLVTATSLDLPRLPTFDGNAHGAHDSAEASTSASDTSASRDASRADEAAARVAGDALPSLPPSPAPMQTGPLTLPALPPIPTTPEAPRADPYGVARFQPDHYGDESATAPVDDGFPPVPALPPLPAY